MWLCDTDPRCCCRKLRRHTNTCMQQPNIIVFIFKKHIQQLILHHIRRHGEDFFWLQKPEIKFNGSFHSQKYHIILTLWLKCGEKKKSKMGNNPSYWGQTCPASKTNGGQNIKTECNTLQYDAIQYNSPVTDTSVWGLESYILLSEF